ncbi:MAG: FAD/NAD(P)-binding protein [Deltaproteobacteria bacterium]|uniref:FAD/NAD(P)-binding protein n=1 Tax=Desulfobacula sp. TaxID=2593537 RepID=UPI0019B2CB63|nr:FAD/NAD(P)-binding protein [Candidatus Desulfobacula maris]MBL6995378.1 FAD/NAD(P)-binding protein [Desulfobacula sp.]
MGQIYSLAIIGCGLTGTSMLCQFIGMVKNKITGNNPVLANIKIIIFEKNSHMGPGLPYEGKNIFPFHISNMPAQDMSIFADRPNDLLDWFFNQKTNLEEMYPELIPFLPADRFNRSNNLYLPRMVMGEYLRSRFDDALETAAQIGIQVVIQNRCTVIDIKENEDQFIVITSDQFENGIKKSVSERVLLATGHWFGTSTHPGYFSSPWPAAQLLEQIPMGANVAVLGTSLSAIDTALTLFSEGDFSRNDQGILTYSPAKNTRQVTLFSRKGFLPKVRGAIGTHQNHYFSVSRLNRLVNQQKGCLRLEDLFYLLKKEIETAYDTSIDWKAILSPQNDPVSILRKDIRQAQQGDNPEGDILWQTILSNDISFMKQAYLNLRPSHRYWFETDFKSAFMSHAAGIPLINAEKILAFMESGVLKLKKLGDSYQLKHRSESHWFEMCFQDDTGKLNCEIYYFVVDARGQSTTYQSNPSKLAKNLLASGLVQIETRVLDENETGKSAWEKMPRTIETGGLWIDPDSCRVMKKGRLKDVSISKNMFAIGIMNKGQVINASMAQECAVSANKVAGYILNDLMKIN